MSFKTRLFASLSLLVSLSHCAPNPVGGDGPTASPEPHGTQAMGAGATPVTGTRVLHSRLDVGDVTQPLDPALWPLSAFALASDGSVRPLTVVETPGAFSIPDAPAGEYYLHLGGRYVVSDARQLDLDRYQLGRSNAALTTSPLPFTVTATGLDPLSSSARFQTVSSNLGALGTLTGQATLTPGATALTNYPMGYSESFPFDGGTRLADATQGDRFYINQVVSRATDLIRYSVIDRSFTPGAFSMDPLATTPTPLSGTFQPVRQQTVSFEWWRSRFEAYQPELHPASRLASQTVSLVPTPWGNDAWYGYSGYLAFLQASPADITDLTPTVTFGNPYPFSWGIAAMVQHTYQVPTLLPGTTSGSLSASLMDTRPLSAFSAGPVAPRISPALELTVDGAAGQRNQALVSLTPRLAWRPPLLGTASAYDVLVYRLRAVGSTTSATLETDVFTAATAVTLPPGVLQPGQQYVFVVKALLTPGVDYGRRPYVWDALNDTAAADAMTGVLSAPGSSSPAPASGGAPNELRPLQSVGAPPQWKGLPEALDAL